MIITYKPNNSTNRLFNYQSQLNEMWMSKFVVTSTGGGVGSLVGILFPQLALMGVGL